MLDEFQTWYDGLTNTQPRPLRNWAFNVVQLSEQGRQVKRLDENTYAILDSHGEPEVRFTTDREFAREQEGVELMGLDHPLVSEALQRWQGLDAEMLGAVVAGDDGPAVVSWWLIQAEGSSGEHRSFVQPLAVSAEGRRMTTLERLGVDLLTRPFGFSGLPLERRRALLHDTIEPMIQRELNLRGLVPENGGYSSKLIGWAEVGGQESVP